MRRFMLLAAMCAALVLALTPAVMAQTNQFNCSDFEFQEDAQEVFNQDTSDPNLLDEDDGVDDGIACENLPSRGTATGATGSQYTQQPTATQYESEAPVGEFPAFCGVTTLDQFPEGTVCTEGGGFNLPEEVPVEVPAAPQASPAATTQPLPATGGPSLVLLAGGLLIGAGLVLRRR